MTDIERIRERVGLLSVLNKDDDDFIPKEECQWLLDSLLIAVESLEITIEYQLSKKEDEEHCQVRIALAKIAGKVEE